LLNRLTSRDALRGLLAAKQAEGRGRRKPIWQDGEGLPARRASSPPDPNAFATLVVGLAVPLSMADDAAVPANWTSSREQVQGGHPGSTFSFASGNAIKRITAGVKARR